MIWYKEEGYIKEGIINFLGLMGYSYGENQEIFSLQEFVDNFNIDKVSLGGPVFDLVKLGWVNNHQMRLKDLDELTKLAVPFFEKEGYMADFETYKKIVEIQRESAQTLKQLAQESKSFFEDEYELPVVTEDMNKKERKSVEKLHSSLEEEVGKKSIALFLEKLNAWQQEQFTAEEAKDLLHSLLDELQEGPGKVFMPLRAVMTGQARGADLYNVLHVIGKKRAIQRIQTMLAKKGIQI